MVWLMTILAHIVGGLGAIVVIIGLFFTLPISTASSVRRLSTQLPMTNDQHKKYARYRPVSSIFFVLHHAAHATHAGHAAASGHRGLLFGDIGDQCVGG